MSSTERRRALMMAGVLAWATTACDRGTGTPSSGQPPGSSGPGPAQSPYKVQQTLLIGGRGSDQARELLILPDGSMVVAGITDSAGLRVSPAAVQRSYADTPTEDPGDGTPRGDAYIARLGPDLSFWAGTYFGGSRQERGVYGMGIDSEGRLAISGSTMSRDLPTTAEAFQPVYGGGGADMFAAKLSPALDRVVWSTYVGGALIDWNRGGLAVGPDGSVYLTGHSESPDYPITAGVVGALPRSASDGVVTRLSPDGTAVWQSTRVGGSDGEEIMGVAVLLDGDVVGAGHTTSSDLGQVTGGGGSDLFFFRLSAAFDAVRWMRRLGGTGNDFGEHLPRSDGARLLVPAYSGSSDFPDAGGLGGLLLFLTAETGAVTRTVRLAGSDGSLLVRPVVAQDGRIYVAGETRSRDFPVTADALQPAFAGGNTDGWFAVLRSDGSIEYASYLGGTGDDLVRAIAPVEGRIVLVGGTTSNDLPGAANANAGQSDMFVSVVGK